MSSLIFLENKKNTFVISSAAIMNGTLRVKQTSNGIKYNGNDNNDNDGHDDDEEENENDGHGNDDDNDIDDYYYNDDDEC